MIASAMLGFLVGSFIMRIYCRDFKYKEQKIPKYFIGDFVYYDHKVYEIEEVRINQHKQGNFSIGDSYWSVSYLLKGSGYCEEFLIDKKVTPEEYAIYNTVLSKYCKEGKK